MQNRGNSITSDLKAELDELYALQIACLEFRHGVRRGSSPWKLFKPSHFVYAYFTFNSIYSVDWDNSFKETEPLEWQAVFNTETNKEEFPSDSKKFSKMISVCYNILGAEAPILILTSLKNHLSEISAPEEELEHINPDSRTENYIDRFRLKFSQLYNAQLIGNRHRDALIDILYFIYLVRNNIFHGSKTTIEMMDERQQSRLAIYTAILLATNELLFETATRKMSWEKPQISFKSNYRPKSTPVPRTNDIKSSQT
jgi:hypothetical protein